MILNIEYEQSLFCCKDCAGHGAQEWLDERAPQDTRVPAIISSRTCIVAYSQCTALPRSRSSHVPYYLEEMTVHSLILALF